MAVASLEVWLQLVQHRMHGAHCSCSLSTTPHLQRRMAQHATHFLDSPHNYDARMHSLL